MSSAELKPGSRIAVIGAGTVGSSCAWHLQRAGLNVSLIDSTDPGQSTSYGNAGCISNSQITPFSYPGVIRHVPKWLFDPLGPMSIRWRYLFHVAPWLFRFWRSASRVDWATRAQARLMKAVHPEWDRLLQATGLEHMRRSQGVIAVYDTRSAFEAEKWMYDYKDELGFDWQHLSPSELKILVPELELEDGMAIFNPDWTQVLDPGELTAAIARDSFSNGSEWLQGKVSAVSVSGQGVALKLESGGKREFDGLVIAAGAWSNHLAGQLDYKVPMTGKRGYHSMIGSPGIDLDYPIISMSRSFVMTPLNKGIRLAGTAEFARLDAEPDYRRAKVLMKLAKNYLPRLQGEDVSEWMGQRPMMADSIPVISRSPRHQNVVYAFGHGHYGLTQGPLTGRLVTDLVLGREATMDMADYDMARFRS